MPKVHRIVFASFFAVDLLADVRPKNGPVGFGVYYSCNKSIYSCRLPSVLQTNYDMPLVGIQPPLYGLPKDVLYSKHLIRDYLGFKTIGLFRR